MIIRHCWTLIRMESCRFLIFFFYLKQLSEKYFVLLINLPLSFSLLEWNELILWLCLDGTFTLPALFMSDVFDWYRALRIGKEGLRIWSIWLRWNVLLKTSFVLMGSSRYSRLLLDSNSVFIRFHKFELLKSFSKSIVVFWQHDRLSLLFSIRELCKIGVT